MLDFVSIKTQAAKNGAIDIYPEFLVKKSKDLMIRGKSFYAIWDEETGLWSTKESKVQSMIDQMVIERSSEINTDAKVNLKLLKNFSSKKWSEWLLYTKSLPDNYHELDERIIFSNTVVNKTDYVSKRLPYAMAEGPTPAYDELMSTLYNPEERQKLEWAIGAIITGDSRKIQKFIVLYGAAGSGKSTVLNIIQDLFEGYYSVFEAKALASSNNAFALEAFRSNPLVAIQHDGDLSRIEDNTKLNSIVSHEMMVVNEKFKATYSSRFNSFLFMGTNKPVKITDAKSGIIRRLIDVHPSGRTLPSGRYFELVAQIKFELGAIAYKCRELYLSMGANYYNKYKPTLMMSATNDFFNFVEDNIDFFKEGEGVSLNESWLRYKEYCTESNMQYPYSKRVFKEELKNYFEEMLDRCKDEHGAWVRSYYRGFLISKFKSELGMKEEKPTGWLYFRSGRSVLDEMMADYPAQYANEDGTPIEKWGSVKTTLKDIDTSKLHYVRIPQNHIVIDFDLKDKDGNKSLELNRAAANKWPKTYAELSKSGSGIHLHYIYGGDVDQLSRLYADNIEIKVFKGRSSLRRMLTKCVNNEVAVINSGLPLKGGKTMVDFDTIKNEKMLRALIRKNLNKEIMPNTKPSMDYIFNDLEKAYKSGMKYDVTDMRPAIMAFANSSTHQASYCLDLVRKMHFKSDEPTEGTPDERDVGIIFYDVEVFPNLFLINWKLQGKDKSVVRMINPTAAEVEKLTKFKLVGFNNRRYDNHILYARMMGYSNEELYRFSQRIINGSKNSMFGEAYNLSYADVYDFSSKKQSLKKWEIELGIHHQELGLPWDQPVPEELWEKVAEYCDNDVIATEATFDHLQQDFIARQVLADLSGLSVNDTTRMHTTKIIFGDDKHPELVYTDLSELFPGYEFKDGRNIYMGEDASFGGYVYAEPGIYTDVALLDVASLHPHSIIELNLFGKYTSKFKELMDARIAIKHHDFDSAKKMLNGVLSKYLVSDDQASTLAQALKIVINSVYGYTSATFDNPFKDPRNKNNIVALRGALFMMTLKHEVQKRGFKVAHIKTDSIKIPNATPEIIEFCMDFAKKYGYEFEFEATYDRMCLVNDAVYIAKYKDGKHAGEWTATGTQFQIPYVFKTLFSHEPIEFDDMCETKSVSTELYLDMNEGLPEGEHDYQFIGKVGRFTPIVQGRGGGELLRKKDDKYYAATGTKGYRWLESEVVKDLHKENDIDRNYYRELVDAAVETISQYGDFEQFVSDSPYFSGNGFMNVPEDEDEEIPF